MDLPSKFCWTKFGTEAGENAPAIRARKEFERSRNGGLFLWGIGNSIRPSLAGLLKHTLEPQIIFTPMLSSPARRDVNPTNLILWTSAVGINGEEFSIPPFSRVTSRGRDKPSQRAHYALVCRSAKGIEQDEDGTKFHASSVRNLLGGSMVGSSQVTSVVARVDTDATPMPNYVVAFRATLAYPFLIKLENPIDVPENPLHTTEFGISRGLAEQHI